MDHSMHNMDMDMGHGHGDMDMGGQCNMNMLFTWSAKDLCIVFRQWHITGPFSLLVSLVVIVLLTAGYEGVRQMTRQFEAAHAQRLSAFTTTTATTGRYFFLLFFIYSGSAFVVDSEENASKQINVFGNWERFLLYVLGSFWVPRHSCGLKLSLTITLEGNEFADESATADQNQTLNHHLPDASSPLVVGRDNRRAVEQRGKIILAALYAVQVFYSFFIMLLFMTYNGLVMIAVAVGAFVGYLVFGDIASAAKTVACH